MNNTNNNYINYNNLNDNNDSISEIASMKKSEYMIYTNVLTDPQSKKLWDK